MWKTGRGKKKKKPKNVPLKTMFQLAWVTSDCMTCTEHMGSARSWDHGTWGKIKVTATSVAKGACQPGRLPVAALGKSWPWPPRTRQLSPLSHSLGVCHLHVLLRVRLCQPYRMTWRSSCVWFCCSLLSCPFLKGMRNFWSKRFLVSEGNAYHPLQVFHSCRLILNQYKSPSFKVPLNQGVLRSSIGRVAGYKKRRKKSQTQ